MQAQRVAVALLPGGSRMAAHLIVEVLEAANALVGGGYELLLAPLGDPQLQGRCDQLWLVAPWRMLAGCQALSNLPSQLQALAARGALLAGVEGGALWLAAAGLLDGRRAASPDWLYGHLQQQHPAVVWCPSLWELDAKPGQSPLLSCSRPLTLPDLLLAQVARAHGDAVARQLAGRLGLSGLRARDERVLGDIGGHALVPPKLAEALALMQANLAEPLPTDDIARLVALSRRQLERLFKQHLDALPSRHYLELRLARARELLKRTGQSILQVGLACGFSSGPHFSNAYKAAYGCTPREERAREAGARREERREGGGPLLSREVRAAA
jgi:AraC family transcriptional regulator, L-arginine-responsive activator